MSFEKIAINFEGFIEVAKEDIKLTQIQEGTGNMVDVDVTNLTTTEILEGVKKGIYYVSLERNLEVALDGETTFDLLDGNELEFRW